MLRYVFAALFTLIISVLCAQDGTLKGIVTDLKTGETLPGASVFIKGTSQGSATDFDGNFIIKSIKPGRYSIVFKYVGYISDTLNNVEIRANSITELNYSMTDDAQLLEQVNIIGEKRTNTDMAVITEIREAKQIVSAISAEMIEKSQDGDAAEVVRRVPGVTIIGNSYIMIRGLNERYNSVMLHDVFAPSMEPDVKSFAFDIIPSGLLDRMLIYKSPAADLPGEFAGGVVKVYTKSIPDSNSTAITVGTTFRAGSSFQDFKQTPRGALHQLGINDGYNDLPSNFPTDIRIVERNNDPEQINRVGRSLKNNWVPETVNSLADKSLAFTKATRTKWGNVEVGNITAINYNNNRTIFEIERNDWNAYDFINDESVPIYEFNDQSYIHNVRTGIIHNWAFRFNANHIIEFKNLLNVSNTTEYVNRTGEDIEFQYFADNHSFDQVYRGIYSGQLMGSHSFNRDNTVLTWAAGMGYAYRDQPDYRRYRSDVDTTDGSRQLFVGVPLSPNYLGRFHSEMRENSQTLNVALQQKLNTSNTFQPLLRTGIFIERKDRRFTARNIGFVRGSIINFDTDLLDSTIDNLFLPENINTQTGIRIGEATNASDQYTASNLLTAAYAGVDLPLTALFSASIGVRAEYNVQQLNSMTIGRTPVVVDNPILSVLPSINLSYQLTERTQLRAAYGMSVNRPEFRELAPFGFYDFNYNLVRKGSDSLRVPTIQNFDLRWEFYPNPAELISVAAFYKRFDDPIETLFVPGGGSGGIKTFTFGNARLATSYGMEVEMRKSMLNLTQSSFIDKFSIVFNASLIKSYVNLGLEDLGQSNERPLQGQSPYIVNAGIYYQNKENGLQMSVMYNLIGPRIFIIGFDEYPDIYEMPRNILDLNFSKRISKHLEVKAGIGDILNQEFLLLQDANNNGKFERDKDQVIQRFNFGSIYSLGVSYRF